MVKKFFSFLLLIFLISAALCAQPRNQRDAAGRRQGLWEAVDSRGMPVFRGYFKDDRPIGEMTRFFPTGEVRVIMHYDSSGTNVRARFFWQSGRIAAQGNYVNMKRDSVWTFFRQDGTVSSREGFDNGKRHGIEQKFYPNGTSIAEEINWVNDVKEGEWKQFYNRGTPKLLATYKNNVLTGEFKTWQPNANMELEGLYVDGLQHGDWISYDENGEYAFTIKYEKGEILNLDELEEAEVIFFRRAMEVQEFIPERTIDDLFM